MSDQIKVELLEWMGSDRSICDSAWTSSTAQSAKSLKTDADMVKLLNLLADEKHSVPFESVVFRFWIRMPIQTDRQHMTHRIASHSGMSGRYRTMPNEYLELPEDVMNILHKDHYRWIGLGQKYHTICAQANATYNSLIEDFKNMEKGGVITNKEYKRLREFFRGILPLNNMTERVTVINLRSFANYIKLRTKPNAQPEIQQVAKLMLEAVRSKGVCPLALQALERNDWVI